MKRWLIALGFASVLVFSTGLMIGFLALTSFHRSGPLTKEIEVIIAKGQTLDTISHILSEANVISNPWFFSWHVRYRNASSALRAGEYRFAPYSRPVDVFEKMIKGDCVIHQVTVPEGTTTTEVIQMLSLNPKLTQQIKESLHEGELLPETYHYLLDDDRNLLIHRMRQAMTQVLKVLWAGRSPHLPFKTVKEALILASIVEKETSLAQERPRIAAVFINRLRKGMPLQSDPTVIYGCVQKHKKPIQTLSAADLQNPTPYNTYLLSGLPPTPICNPGRASIEAVLHPLPYTKELYFVADGTGGHVFSETYEEHKKHHQKWREISRQRQKITPSQ